MKKFLIAIFCVTPSLWFTDAQAQTPRSEYFFQAQEDEMFVDANINISRIAHDIRGMNEEVKLSDLFVDVSLEFSYSSNWAFYGKIGYGKGKLRAAPGAEIGAEGPDALHLGVKYQRNLSEISSLFMRLDLALAMIQALDCSASLECNRLDRSLGTSLHVGYLHKFDHAYAGLAADIGLFSTDGKAKQGDSFDKQAGFGLTAFYELILSEHIWGFSAGLKRTGLASFPPMSLYYNDAPDADMTVTTLKTYGRFHVDHEIQFLGGFAYHINLDQGDDTLDGGSGFEVHLGARVYY